ncbi:hypothetical protein E3U55_08245 [Filobacillus milosensis]|uniref:Lipoprotein n=1 Tax=Filobacillus milosensis TaxID=94137 RepID=A0A4Y8IN69_9BACI|nr:hypothetical protein [Filobacillus milosensis]TFB21805.1 hypothetical protein E3U55_08245 [Filobacillus milosensis]
MTTLKSLLALGLLSLIMLLGCSNHTQSDSENNQIHEDIIANDKTLPDHFHEIAFERYLIRKAVNESEFEQTWNLYEFDKKIPKVDFKEKEVIFIGLHESSSCPYNNVDLSSDNKTMIVQLSGKGGESCTADASPRTFVIQIDQGITAQIENVSFGETKVPLKK